MPDVWIKFCGCTSPGDVALAAEAGADAFGMIFAPSPRRLAPDSAEEIARHLPVGIAPVAVFVNPEHAEVERVRELFPRAFLQFSGDETPEFVGRYGERAIKAVHIDERAARVAERCERYAAALLLFDARHDGLAGGTGRTFDWNVVSEIAARRRVLVAGGLDPRNVAECVRLARPFGVDVRNGIESGGVKDAAKMRAFVRAVREES